MKLVELQKMMKRLSGRIRSPNPFLALVGAIVGLFAAWQLFNLLSSGSRLTALFQLPMPELAALFVGLISIAWLIVRSIVNDLRNIFVRESRIVCGSGQAGTAYDYNKLLSDDPEEVFIVAQNLKTLLDENKF